MIVRTLACALATAVAFGMFSADANAQSNDIKCTFLEVQASNTDAGVDKKLTRLSKKFKKPPFTAWTSFKLIQKHEETLTRDKAKDIKLKLGGKLTAIYQDHTKGKKDRYTVSIKLANKKGKRFFKSKLSINSGDYALVTMPAPKQDGVTIFASTCQ